MTIYSNIILGIFIMFQLVIIQSVIKNLAVNGNDYSRLLRVQLLMVYIAYLGAAISILTLVLIRNNGDILANNLDIGILVTVSIMMFMITTRMDHKKISAGDKWNLINIESDPKVLHMPKPIFERVEQWIYICSWIGSFGIVTSRLLISGESVQNVSAIISYVFLIATSIYYCYERNVNGLSKNIEYNFIKQLVEEDILNNRTDVYAAQMRLQKAIKLFEEIFQGKFGYRGQYSVAINNEIISAMQELLKQNTGNINCKKVRNRECTKYSQKN